MGSLQRFAKAVVEGDAEDVTIYRRPGSEIVVVGKSDRWTGSIGAWQGALTTALADAQMTRQLHDLFVQAKTSPIDSGVKEKPMTTICGHDRDDIGQVLIYSKSPKIRDLDAQLSALRFMFGDVESKAMQAAAVDCYDVSKLAEMGVHEMRRCGVDKYECDPVRVADACMNVPERMTRRVRLFIGNSESYCSFAPDLFRRKLLMLLDVPDGDRERAESILVNAT